MSGSGNAPTAPVEASGSEREPITHDVKCWPGPFDARAAGLKPWELRANDRDYRVGDILRQRRFDPERQEFTSEVDERPITWALYGPAFGLPEGQVIMTLGEDALRPQPSGETREAVARIVDPTAWEILDQRGAKSAEEIGITTARSLEKTDAILALLSTRSLALGGQQGEEIDEEDDDDDPHSPCSVCGDEHPDGVLEDGCCPSCCERRKTDD